MSISMRCSPGTRKLIPTLACSVLFAVGSGLALAAGTPESPATDRSAAGQSTTDGEQAAVWTPKEVTFVYQGFTARYSCDGLRDKVRSAVLQLGANKKELKVTEWGCAASLGRPDRFPGVRIKMSVLTPASGSADGDDKTVPSHWKPVDLNLKDIGDTTDSGTCELVEQIKAKIVPLFTARNVDLQSQCIPHQASAAGPSLKLEVLMPDRKSDKSDRAGGADKETAKD